MYIFQCVPNNSYIHETFVLKKSWSAAIMYFKLAYKLEQRLYKSQHIKLKMIITAKLKHHTCRIQTILSPKFQFDLPIATTQVITVVGIFKKIFYRN